MVEHSEANIVDHFESWSLRGMGIVESEDSIPDRNRFFHCKFSTQDTSDPSPIDVITHFNGLQ